jgi:hypothetical protein
MRLVVVFGVCALSLSSACGGAVAVPAGAASDMSNVSDRNLKTDFEGVDPAAVLQKVVDLPISSWRFKMDRPDVRHLGPTAQDFHGAFGLGNSDRLLMPLDAGGVSLAAIQALHARLVDAEAENQRLRGRVDALEQRLAALEAQ